MRGPARAGPRAVARARGWHGTSITHSSCPLSAATRRLPEPKRSSCRRWTRWVPRWLRGHPEVRTVFVAALSGSGFETRAGGDRWDTAVAGYTAAWRRLPASVERIVALRDPPKSTHAIADCVMRVRARGRAPGPTCARPRDEALTRDSLVAAATAFGSPRVGAIDLTDVFCDARRCFPVIGGVLVTKDIGHLTPLFSTTLGPLVGRALDRLAAG